MESILKSGHSRILVHKRGDRTSILGTVLVKELILVDPNANQPISSMKVRHVPHLLAETPMYDMLRLFKTGRTHMAVLTQPTLEAYTRAGLEIAESADLRGDGRHRASLTAMASMTVHLDERDREIESPSKVQLVDDDGEVVFNPTAFERSDRLPAPFSLGGRAFPPGRARPSRRYTLITTVDVVQQHCEHHG